MNNNNSAAPGPDGVPARLLKGCAHAKAVPLELIWRFLDERVVPSYYKLFLVPSQEGRHGFTGKLQSRELKIAYRKGL